MNGWQQIYDPFGLWQLSTFVSALPVLSLFFVLIVLKKRVWMAALTGMLVAMGLAWGVFGMPATMIAGSCLLGFVFGFLRIAWIIVASIFLYNIAVETGQFEIMKESIATLSTDLRLQLVLIAFCFGAFLEGTGGGGAPVAIAGAFLIGLGFPPFKAATLCLIANTAPVAWGGVGNPIRVLAGVTSLPEATLSAMAGRILSPISMILPLWLVRCMVGWRDTLQVWPALAVSGVSFAAMKYYWSNYQESGLVDVVASIFSLLVMVAFLKVWRPAQVLAFDEQDTKARHGLPSVAARRHSVTVVLKGWSPFLLASVFIFLAGIPSVGRAIGFAALRQPMPLLHNAVLRVPPAVPQPTPEAAIADLNFPGAVPR